MTNDTTSRLGLPLLMEAQAQKHVTVNEAMTRLDWMVSPVLTATDLSDPPAAPAADSVYALGDAPNGVWAGHAGELAHFRDGVWSFAAPWKGLLAYADGGALMGYDGSAWEALGLDTERLGINTSADAYNRLSVRSDAALFTASQDDIRIAINKTAESAVGALIFQTGYAARAEFGLVGSDEIALRVQGDDGTWRTLLQGDRNTGGLSVGGVPVESLEARGALIATVAETYASGTDGGDFMSGARRVRNLNRLDVYRAADITLSGGALTLPAGEFFLRWRAGALGVNRHMTWIRDTTNDADLARGSSAYSAKASEGWSESCGIARISLDAQTVIVLEHQAQDDELGRGFGLAGGFDEEIYALLEVYRQ